LNDHFIKKAQLPENLPNLPDLEVTDSELNEISVSEEDVEKVIIT